MEINESKKKNKKTSKNKASKESIQSIKTDKSFSQKTWDELQEIFQMEEERSNIIQNDITKPKNIPEQIKDYYKVISIDDSKLPSKKKIICQKFINYYGEKKEDILIDNTKITIYLQDFWAQTLLFPSDIVFISATYDKSLKGYCIKMNFVDKKISPYGAVKAFLKNFIVVNPEISIIPTYIKYAKNCVRYAFLKNNIRSVTDIDITLSTIVGEIVHELFEYLLSFIKRDDKNCDMINFYQERFQKKGAEKDLKKIMSKEDYTYKASLIGVSENVVFNESKNYIFSIKKFFDEYVLNIEELNILGIKTNNNQGCYGIKVINYISSEEKLISPILGIQGNMDVYVEFQEGKKKFKGALEIKTGDIKFNTIENDSVQILLYSLLLGQCHNDDADKGLLIYLKGGLESNANFEKNRYNNKFVVEIEFMPGMLVGAITKRNELSHYLKEKFILDEKNKISNKYLKKISTHKILKLNVPKVLEEFNKVNKEGVRNICDFCFKRQKAQCSSLYYLNEFDSDKYDNEIKKYFNFYYNVLNNECYKNYEDLKNYNLSFNNIDYTLFSIIGISESEHDSNKKSYSFDLSLKQTKIIDYDKENDDENEDEDINIIKKETNFSFDKKNYILYIEEINKYLFGYKIKSNEKDKTLLLQVPKIYCSPWEDIDGKERKKDLNFEKLIQKYLNKIKTNRKIYLREVDAVNDYSYSLYLGNLLSFIGEPKNNKLNAALEKVKNSINQIKTKYKNIELDNKKTQKNQKDKNKKDKENNENKQLITIENRRNMQMEIEKEEINKRKIKEEIEVTNRINELHTYLIGKKLTKPQFYGTKENILKLFDYFIKHNSLYLKEYDFLNNQQKKAFIFANTTDKYLLIQGFPGSGKTTFITYLLRGFAIRKLKCLFVAHTNVAVDNVCLKLKQKNINFIRIAPINSELVHPEIKKYILDYHQFKTIEEYENHINNTKIVATTTASIGHKIFQNIFFEFGIFDEVCQTFEPELLGPLILCDKFIFVGDPNQLKSPMKTIPLNEQIPTLFERLSNEYKNAFIKFNIQYRMNEEISELSSACVYNGEMKCDIKNKNSKLKIDFSLLQKKNIKSYINKNNYIINADIFKDILNPNKSVVFIEYKNLYKEEELNEANYVNKIEINLIKEILILLNKCNFDLNEIGVITPFLKQEKYMSKELEEINFKNVYTIDKSQGSEKEIIIISFVKTSFNNSIVNDLARINVAFTRAKKKLIIFGFKDILVMYDNVEKYIHKIEEMHSVYDLSKRVFI